MLDIKLIRENLELVKENSKNRLVDVDVEELMKLDEEKRQLDIKIDELRAQRNEASKTKPTPEIITKMKQVGVEISELEKNLLPLGAKIREISLKIPNLTHPDVKVSSDENDNPVLETNLEPTKFDFEPKDHVQLAESLDLIDFDRATKVTGNKFYYLKNELAQLEFALVQYALEILVKKGFTPFTTPDLAKKEVLEGLGFNPRGESTQVYSVENSDLCLIGTSEITMGGYHMNEIINESDLPKKYAAVSHCFRTESGSYSKFSKGIFRIHQFTKIEMFGYVLPTDSEKMHQELLEVEKEIFANLGIPFRVIDHCTADLGGPSYRTYDLEAWMPGKPNADGGMGDWAEITSTSNCTDYQSRGLNIKYQDQEGNKNFVHTLNGTAIAIPRALISIIENFQTKDGSIKIPEVLHKYVNFKEIKEKK